MFNLNIHVSESVGGRIAAALSLIGQSLDRLASLQERSPRVPLVNSPSTIVSFDPELSEAYSEYVRVTQERGEKAVDIDEYYSSTFLVQQD